MVNNLERIIIVTGHSGSGKTNLSINIAIDIKKQNNNVTLVDLDIVNPYFRTSNFKHIVENKNINVITTNYANSNIDIPSLALELNCVCNSDSYLIIDVGGGDVGSKVLGRYANYINQRGYSMLYMHNTYRYQGEHIEESKNLILSIENSSRLTIDYIVNNSNLGELTTIKDVESSLETVNKVSKKSNKDILFTLVKRDILGYPNISQIYPIDIYVKAPWN